MKKRILSCLMALALCLTLLPTAALADEPADPANEGPKQEQENQEQETQQEQPTEEKTPSPMPLGTPVPAAAVEHQNHCICGAEHKSIGDHNTRNNAFTDAKVLKMESNGTLKMDDSEWKTTKYDGTTYLPLEKGSYYLETDLTLNQYSILISGDVTLCLNGCSITCENPSTNYVIAVYADTASKLTLTDCKNIGKIEGGKSAAVELRRGYTLNMYGGTISGNNGGVFAGTDSEFNMSGGEITGNNGGGVEVYIKSHPMPHRCALRRPLSLAAA